MSDIPPTIANPGKLLRIAAPQWYTDREFIRWLNSSGTATWHEGGEPSEMSDVFTHYCQGEGSDYPSTKTNPGIPEKIWAEISALATEHFGEHAECLVWISNC